MQCEVNKKESEFNTPSPITLKIVQHNFIKKCYTNIIPVISLKKM